MFFSKTKKYLSIEEAAAILGKSTGQIELYIWLRRIKNVEKTAGGGYNIPKEEVYRLQDDQEEYHRKQEKNHPPIETPENESFSFL